MVDVGVHFIKGTYLLEGDGVLVLNCYEEILKIRNAVHTGHYPNLQLHLLDRHFLAILVCNNRGLHMLLVVCNLDLIIFKIN